MADDAPWGQETAPLQRDNRIADRAFDGEPETPPLHGRPEEPVDLPSCIGSIPQPAAKVPFSL